MRVLDLVQKKSRVFVAAAVLSLGLASTAAAAYYILPPPYAAPYKELGGKFWNFVLKQPVDTNPLFDNNGARCRNGQTDGRFFFLVGATDATPVKRTCTVPALKSVVIPIINAFSGATADDPPSKKTVAYQRAQVDYIKKAKNLKLVIDGSNVSNVRDYLFESDRFSVTLGEDNIFGAESGTVVDPSVDTGWYVVLAPWYAGGKHTVYFHAELAAADNPEGTPVTIDVKYDLTATY